MRIFSGCRTLTSNGLLMILICGLSVPAAFGQTPNANQWYGWAHCTVNVQGPAIDGNGTILGQYFHRETQTWQLTGAAPAGTTYPATWNVNGSGSQTVGSGSSWTLSSPVLSAPLTIEQRASDNNWIIVAGAHSQISGQWATITPHMASPTTSELVFPSVSGGPQATTMVGSSTVADSAGKYGILQPGGPTSQISCGWNFSKGVIPPPPLEILFPPPTLNLKPPTAPAGSLFVPITPCRVVDTREGRHFPGTGGIYPSAPATFQIGGVCGVPALTPTALSLNVTAVPIAPSLTGMSIWPDGAATEPLLSAPDGQPTANAVILPFGSGAVQVSVTDRSHVLIDVNGYFMPMNTAQGSAFYPRTPCHALNTMNSNSPLAPAVASDVDVRTACSIPSWATAVVMNVTVLPKNGFLGFLEVWASGTAQPPVSNINAYDGQVKSNMVIAQTGTNGHVTFFASDATNVVADVVGYFGTPGGAGALTFHLPDIPGGCTAVNTMLVANSTVDFQINQAGICGIPGWARAYSLNYLAVPNGPLTGLTIQPMGIGNVPSSSLYAADGQETGSVGIVATGTGGVSVTSFNPTNFILTISGYFD